MKPKGLGRGLENLLGPRLAAVPVSLDLSAPAAPATPSSAAPTATAAPSQLPIAALQAGRYQPRVHMDEGALQELADSIRSQGIMQPILVRPLQKNAIQSNAYDAIGDAAPSWEIIAGERRFRAAQMAGLSQVPVLVRDVSDETATIMALIENMQREGLNPLEEARGLARLVQEFGLSHEQAAQAVGRSRSAASNLMRLLNLAPPVQEMLQAGDLDMGHARALLSLSPADQIRCANVIAARKLNVRQAEGLVKKALATGELSADASAQAAAAADTTSAAPRKDRDFVRMEEMLCDELGTRVEIRLKKQADGVASGEISLSFNDAQSLHALIARLRGGVAWEG